MTAIGPVDAVAAATRGLRQAETRAAAAATRIAAMGAPAPEAPDLTAVMQADPGLAMVDLLAARRAYQANAAVLRSADAMQRDLLRA